MDRWTFEDEKYLQDNWRQADLSFIVKTLNRTENSVIKKAQRIGLDTLKAPDKHLKKKWTAAEEKILQEYYSVKPICELLGFLPDRTKDSVIKKAKQLGINSENRHWSEEEILYLEEKWGVIPVENIAKKLGRTKNGVLLKAHKIGLREQVIANGEYLTPKDIATILGAGTRTVYNWMGKGYLKYRRLKINSVKKYQITIDNFNLFLENYQDKWDSRTADIKYINSCFITGSHKGTSQTPEWLESKIKLDKQKKSQLCRKQWTVKEEATLKSMINTGKTYREIAELLDRSFYSVQGKVASRINQLINI
jgi:DNA-binding CsgD family transcriptional regulator